jgi:uncharacterized SAM-binding protein YcdF (DUF218 family)
MKKILKGFLAIYMTVIMAFSLTSNVFAAEVPPTAEEEALISEIVTYYARHTDGDYNEDNGWTASAINADIDIQRCLAELTALNPALGEAVSNIMNYWQYADTTMPINTGVLPNGLPNDNSLCIVTLGFQLDQTTGQMQQELVDRLNVTLASAQKYPNAYLAVTGGGTSPADRTKTEGKLMADWLIANGISADRIIVEDRAGNTVGNATYTFALLKQKPEITSIAMISSSSHVQRGVAIFQATFQLEAYKADTAPIAILDNASCPVTRQESLSAQVSAVVQSINAALGSNVRNASSIELSTLNSISINGVNETYTQGDVVTPTIIANFTTPDGEPFQVDITEVATVGGLDTSVLGEQVLTVSYSYNDSVQEEAMDVTVNAVVDIVPDEPKPEEPTPVNPIPENPTVVKTGDDTIFAGFISVMILAASGYLYLRRKEI